MRSKEQYEELIKRSILFELSSDDINYNKERLKLCHYLIDYFEIYIYKDLFNNMIDVFMETFDSCISSFTRESGEFLHYMNSSLKNNYKRARIKEEINNRRMGISVPQKKERLSINIIKYARSNGLDINDEECKHKLAGIFNIDINTLNECIEISNICVVGNIQYNASGEEFDLYDTVVMDEEQEDDSAEILEALLKVAAQVFNNLQDRQKQLISLFFTKKCFDIFEKDYGVQKAHMLLKNYSFYNIVIYKFCVIKKRTPTQRELANYLGVSEQSASRSYSVFEQKIRENVKF